MAFFAAIEPLAEFLAGLEERHKLLSNRYSRTGSRIAALPSRPVLYREGAETAQLDPISPRKSFDDLIEHNIDDALYVTVIEMRIGTCDLVNQLGFDHYRPRCKLL